MILEADRAVKAGDAVATDPNLAGFILRDVHAPGAAQVQALGGDIGAGHVAVSDQPLGQTGVEAAGDRVFVHAHGGGKGADFKLGGLGGSTNVVSDRLVHCAKCCISSADKPVASNTTASGLPL